MFYFQQQVFLVPVFLVLCSLYYLLLPPPWTDYCHTGRFSIAFIYFDYTCYTPYFADSDASLAGFIALHLRLLLLALLSTYIVTVQLCFCFQRCVPFPFMVAYITAKIVAMFTLWSNSTIIFHLW